MSTGTQTTNSVANRYNALFQKQFKRKNKMNNFNNTQKFQVRARAEFKMRESERSGETHFSSNLKTRVESLVIKESTNSP